MKIQYVKVYMTEKIFPWQTRLAFDAELLGEEPAVDILVHKNP